MAMFCWRTKGVDCRICCTAYWSLMFRKAIQLDDSEHSNIAKIMQQCMIGYLTHLEQASLTLWKWLDCWQYKDSVRLSDFWPSKEWLFCLILFSLLVWGSVSINRWECYSRSVCSGSLAASLYAWSGYFWRFYILIQGIKRPQALGGKTQIFVCWLEWKWVIAEMRSTTVLLAALDNSTRIHGKVVLRCRVWFH